MLSRIDSGLSSLRLEQSARLRAEQKEWLPELHP
jgi:hypothetical protein